MARPTGPPPTMNTSVLFASTVTSMASGGGLSGDGREGYR